MELFRQHFIASLHRPLRGPATGAIVGSLIRVGAGALKVYPGRPTPRHESQERPRAEEASRFTAVAFAVLGKIALAVSREW